MADNIQQVRAFVASPGDVKVERAQLERVVREINQTVAAIAPERRIALELVRWETNVAPGLARDAQDVVTRQIGTYEIFIGMMWKRFGTPTAVADSGTEEEFRQAYATWEQDERLQVLFYFCQAPSPPPATIENMPSGDTRTRRMTLIESRMRALTLSIYPLLPELTQSASAGERLAAIAALKEMPDPRYLLWLAERVGTEKPFIGYQATRALESAARNSDAASKDAVLAAVKEGQRILANLQFQDPNQVRTLEAAEAGSIEWSRRNSS